MSYEDKSEHTTAEAPPDGLDHPEPLWCEACGKSTDLRVSEVCLSMLPNTLTPLKDHNSPRWKC